MAEQIPLVALVGNPNTGKTTLFNSLAGMNQRVGNYPGVTIETKKGRLHHGNEVIDLLDLPGTYSLAPRSPDEMVAVEVILGHKEGERRPDAVLVIVDASNLERNLYLTTQVLELGVPVVVALNMIDVATHQGLKIDVQALSRKLGLPVIPIQANKGRGIEELKNALSQVLRKPASVAGPVFPPDFEQELDQLAKHLPADEPRFLVRRLLLDVGGYTEELLTQKHGKNLQEVVKAARQRLHAAGHGVPAVEARTRYGWIRQVTAGSIQRPAQRPVTWTDRIDKVLTHWFCGTLVFFAVMFLVFQAIFTGAQPLMDAIKAGQGWLADAVREIMAPGPLRSLIADGVINGVGSVIVFLPQILILFAFVALLEDCGYMARAAFLMDRLMSRAGLNGKSFIPLLSSLACAVPGIMSARVIENRRDRFATILVAPLMSCSARLPVYSLLIAAFLQPGPDATLLQMMTPGLTLLALYMIGFILAPLIAFFLKSSLLRGETPVFVMEMPLYKLPSITHILRRALEAGWMFIYRAGTLIFCCMILVWALLYFPGYHPSGERYEEMIVGLEKLAETQKGALEDLSGKIEEMEEAKQEVPGELYFEKHQLEDQVDDAEASARKLAAEWKGQSYLGRLGKFMEPAVRPLGWDWRIGMAALASFPAREVMVGTLGIIFGEGEGDDEAFQQQLGDALREATWDQQPHRKLFTFPVALSIMVFFALCCQCVSTLAVIQRETQSWWWPTFTFFYMTALAYVGALLTYQVGSWLTGAY